MSWCGRKIWKVKAWKRKPFVKVSFFRYDIPLLRYCCTRRVAYTANERIHASCCPFTYTARHTWQQVQLFDMLVRHIWSDVRAVDGGSLENYWGAILRGFESLSLRKLYVYPSHLKKGIRTGASAEQVRERIRKEACVNDSDYNENAHFFGSVVER